MILGLTGGIATGKSTVADFFRNNNIPVICADAIAREITESKEILDKISLEFGKEMILNGKLDRKKMREYIFVDINRVKKLNEITHPPIIEKIKKDTSSIPDMVIRNISINSNNIYIVFNNSLCVPIPTHLPLSRTSILSAFIIVPILWATIKLVASLV